MALVTETASAVLRTTPSGEPMMAKGQKRSTREAKKPKANKAVVAPSSSLLPPRPAKPVATKSSDK